MGVKRGILTVIESLLMVVPVSLAIAAAFPPFQAAVLTVFTDLQTALINVASKLYAPHLPLHLQPPAFVETKLPTGLMEQSMTAGGGEAP